MSEEPAGAARDAELERLLARIAANSDAIEEALELVERLADTGLLAATNGVLEDWDELFGALTRPDVSGMVANLMMLLGVLSETDYRPFFDTAMRTPAALGAGYERFQEREEKLKLREAVELLRSPEVAGALEMVATVLKAQRGH